MNQFIGISKIGGKAAIAAAERFAGWHAQRIRDPDDPLLIEPSQWPEKTIREIGAFRERLRENVNDPPVLYHSLHADMCSSGNVFIAVFPIVGSPVFEFCLHDGMLYGYALPDDGAMARRLKRLGRIKDHAKECLWFERSLQQAIDAWEPSEQPSFLVIDRFIVGGLVTDDEVAESLRTVPDWILE
jgi:hypothetical protein